MALTLDDLFASPDHYLHSFEGDAALFVPMDRAAYHRSIFLDGRISPAADGALRLPVTSLGKARRRLPTSWIFHVAHCGSTLLARALDAPSSNLVLREPLALRQTAIARDGERLALVAAMVSKRYQADAPTIVKANVPVNFLVPELAGLDGEARAIFLYLGLRDYLLAILRSGNHREWLRRVTSQLEPHLGDLSQLADAERAAALWLGQMRAFARASAMLPNAVSLDAESLFADPHRAVGAAARHLGVPITDAALDERVKGPLFATYSKNPDVAFDNRARLARREQLEIALAAELALAARWIERNAGEAGTAEAALSGADLLDRVAASRP